MRVLHISSTLDPAAGGTVAAAVGLARAQAQAGIDVRFAATWSPRVPPKAADELRQHGIEVHLIGPTRTSLLWHKSIGSVLRQAIADADVVHIHAVWEEIQHRAARIARELGKPYVITAHGMLTPWSLAQSRFKKRLYMLGRLMRNLREAAAIHYTTQVERDSVALNLPVPTIVEPLGVDLREFEHLPAAGTFRKQHPETGSRQLIAFLGRIHPGKGLEYLIPALARVEPPDAMLVVIGPDSEGFLKTMRMLAQSHGVADRVLFTGMLAGAARVPALADADIFALPSDHENFGVAVIEALAAGTPVIISEHVAIQKQIAAAAVGAVTSQEPADIAREISRWLADAGLRKAAGERARPFVWQTYDWRRIVQRWEDHYRRLMTKPTSHQRGDLPA